jgi:hypothetical protein
VELDEVELLSINWNFFGGSGTIEDLDFAETTDGSG